MRVGVLVYVGVRVGEGVWVNVGVRLGGVRVASRMAVWVPANAVGFNVAV